jgi:hypothetical protein
MALRDKYQHIYAHTALPDFCRTPHRRSGAQDPRSVATQGQPTSDKSICIEMEFSAGHFGSQDSANLLFRYELFLPIS